LHTGVRVRTFLSDGLWHAFEPFGVGGNVFQLGDAQLKNHVADARAAPAQRRQDERQRLARLWTAAAWWSNNV